MNLEVGEIVKVQKEEQFPADLIFLKCSEKNGIAFVDTMNLDGEVLFLIKIQNIFNYFFLKTNLKEKLVFLETQEIKEDEICNLKGYIECDAPNESLETFDSNIMMNSKENDDQLPYSLRFAIKIDEFYFFLA